MNREIKFNAWNKETKTMHYDILHPDNWSFSFLNREVFTWLEFTGLKDKDGMKEIFEGDIVRYREPYRTTQTHEGDNIPNGSCTEPMEAGIKEIVGSVVFTNGLFHIDDEDDSQFKNPLTWYDRIWDLEEIKQAISWTRQNAGWFDDPEEGDLQYLISECAKVENENQLIEYLSGLEVLGNIFEHPNLL